MNNVQLILKIRQAQQRIDERCERSRFIRTIAAMGLTHRYLDELVDLVAQAPATIMAQAPWAMAVYKLNPYEHVPVDKLPNDPQSLQRAWQTAWILQHWKPLRQRMGKRVLFVTFNFKEAAAYLTGLQVLRYPGLIKEICAVTGSQADLDLIWSLGCYLIDDTTVPPSGPTLTAFKQIAYNYTETEA